MREETQLDHLPFTAYHESGHAVALCLLNIPFSHTTITSSEEFGYVGYTKWIPKDNPSRQEQLDIMVIALAGIVATLQLDGSYREAALAGTGNDLQCLEKIADNLTTNPEEFDQLIEHTKLRTTKLLTNHWIAVRRVAEALLEKHTLSYVTVQQIVNEN